MTPEEARLLRDRKCGHHWPRGMHASGTHKRRELRFDSRHPEQLQQAHQLLLQLEGVQVDPGRFIDRLLIQYDLLEHTLRGIEVKLIRAGIALHSGPLHRLMRALTHFAEETELRNLHGPQRLIKKSHDIYSTAWDHHPHGDHDDAPPDLRAEK